MLDIDDYKKLSPEAKKFYNEHEEYFDKMADKWGDFVDMAAIIEQDTKNGEVEEPIAEVITAD